jgi:hypothetical protein
LNPHSRRAHNELNCLVWLCWLDLFCITFDSDTEKSHVHHEILLHKASHSDCISTSSHSIHLLESELPDIGLEIDETGNISSIQLIGLILKWFAKTKGVLPFIDYDNYRIWRRRIHFKDEL